MSNAPHIEEELVKILGANNVSSSQSDKLNYGRDMWPKFLIDMQFGILPKKTPHFIVWPNSEDQVQAIVRLANRTAMPIIPWGGGSGVCGGLTPLTGGIALDLKGLNRCLGVRDMSHLATYEAGIIGQVLEDDLNKRGLTLGHFPSSIYSSTLGGWIATRSAGQYSTRYGKIEDMVESLTCITGVGEKVTLKGSEINQLGQLVIGNEGTLALITSATVKVHPLAESRIFRGYECSTVDQGLSAMQEVMQAGLKPAVLRLYDPLDTFISGKKKSTKETKAANDSKRLALSNVKPFIMDTLLPKALNQPALINRAADLFFNRLKGDHCKLVVGFEGKTALVGPCQQLAHDICQRNGLKDIGSAPGEHWYHHRHDVSYKQSPLYSQGVFVDTLEVAISWDKVRLLYDEVRESLASKAAVLAHFSHAYTDGCSIYFTFATQGKSHSRARRAYDEIWRNALTAVTRVGGSISHHHGIGISKAPFMAREHGDGMKVMRQLKQAFDPNDILNPGKLLS